MPALTRIARRKSLPFGVIGLAALFLALDFLLFAAGEHSADRGLWGVDWAPLWLAGGLAWSEPLRAYDFALLTHLQAPMFGVIPPRPFIYTPATLMLLAPFGLIPFYAALAAFVAPSLALLAAASRPIRANPAVLLLAPPVLLAAFAGQPTLLVAALLLFALAALPDDERLAGLLFGVCAVIKPQLLLLVPLALLAGRHWRALASAAATTALLCLASLALFGFEAWRAWFEALGQFRALFESSEPLLQGSVTPQAFAALHGFETGAVAAIAVLIAVPAAWIAFRRGCDLSIRLAIIVGGALLLSPYAMNYELAALAPAVAAMDIKKRANLVLALVWGSSLFLQASLIGLLAIYGWALARLVIARFQPETISRCSSGSTLPPERTAAVASSG
jgi:hypothetical protein